VRFGWRRRGRARLRWLGWRGCDSEVGDDDAAWADDNVVGEPWTTMGEVEVARARRERQGG
jgi:hypothetical protein